MNILLLGATGFIGSALFHALVSKHNVTIASRSRVEGYLQWLHVDFEREVDWKKILTDVDLVINAVGIIDGPLDQVHNKAPKALFSACIQQGCRIIQISAIGAERENAPTEFLRSKHELDAMLLAYPNARIIYPGIVIGKNGTSTRFVKEIAELPIVPIFANTQPPCIHITQLVRLVMSVVECPQDFDTRVFAVSAPEPFEKILAAIRGRKMRSIQIPVWTMSVLFKIVPTLRIGIFSKDMFAMLVSTNSSNYKSCCEAASECIDSKELQRSQYLPKLACLAALFCIWLWSGITSLISWQQSQSIMAQIGVTNSLHDAFIWAGSLADILLAFALCFRRYRTQVLWTQIALITVYTLVLTILAPTFWLHPFGPVLKNLGLVALSYMLIRQRESGAE